MGRRCVCPRVFAPPRPLASALIRGKCESRYECNRRGVAGPNGLVQTVIIITIRISQLGSKRDRDYRELSVGRRLWKILNHPSRIRHVAARCRNMLDGRACGGLGAQLMRSLKRAGASMGSMHLITFGSAIASVAGSGLAGYIIDREGDGAAFAATVALVVLGFMVVAYRGMVWVVDNYLAHSGLAYFMLAQDPDLADKGVETIREKAAKTRQQVDNVTDQVRRAKRSG